MSACDFVETTPTTANQIGEWTCTVCGTTARTNARPHNPNCPGPNHKPKRGPGIMRKARNFAGSMGKAALDGFARATAEQVAERLAICQDCDQFDEAGNQCRACGCLLKYKPHLRSAVCELGKWPAITPK